MSARELAAVDRTWAIQQIAQIVGATTDDAAPLAEFLLGIEDSAELQGQLLDMLGESPLALDFASALLTKRFPPASVSEQTPPLLPARNQAQESGSTDQAPPEQKSQRQIKRERQAKARQEREEKERRRRLANRKRVKCECQAAEHPLFTNCLSCGRVICDSEGPGPCMFCGSMVESPGQQLQLHMRRLVQRTDTAGGDGPVNGHASAAQAPQLLWTKPGATDTSTDELSDEEYRAMAFQTLGIDKATADAESLRVVEAWTLATRRKERLLGFDRTAAQRTRLIDESADFDPDAISKWMSPEEKQVAELRRSERQKSEQEREDRRRRGVRVLRLNLGNATADLSRGPDDDDDDGGDVASKGRPEPKPSAKPASSGPARKPAKAASSASGAFAHNPLLGEAAEPRFVLAVAKKAAGKGKGATSAATDISRKRQALRLQDDGGSDEIF